MPGGVGVWAFRDRGTPSAAVQAACAPARGAARPLTPARRAPPAADWRDVDLALVLGPAEEALQAAIARVGRGGRVAIELVLHDGLAVLPPDRRDLMRHALSLQELHNQPDRPQVSVERGRRLILGSQYAPPRDGLVGHVAVRGRRAGARGAQGADTCGPWDSALRGKSGHEIVSQLWCGQALWQDVRRAHQLQLQAAESVSLAWSPHPELNRGPRPYQGFCSQRCGAHLETASETRPIMVWCVFGGHYSPARWAQKDVQSTRMGRKSPSTITGRRGYSSRRGDPASTSVVPWPWSAATVPSAN